MDNKGDMKYFLLFLILFIGCASPGARNTYSWEGQRGPVAKEIMKRLNNNENVKVINMGNVETSYPVSAFETQADLDKWKKVIIKQIISKTELSMIDEFREYGNFEVIDRSTLDAILKEQYLGLTGFILQSDAVEVG